MLHAITMYYDFISLSHLMQINLIESIELSILSSLHLRDIKHMYSAEDPGYL